LGRTIHVEESVAIARPPAEVWSAIEGGRAVRPDDDGTGAVFTYTIEFQPTGGMRALGPLLGPIVRSGLKKDLQRLRALLDDGR
jgi:hypothetical protein